MKEHVLIGGYTKQASRGIYQLSFDSQQGQLSSARLAVNLEGPTYFTISNANILYSVAKTKTQGGVAAFDLEHNFQLLGQVLQPGPAPAYIEVSDKKQLVFTANFHSGIVNIYRIQADSTLTLTDQIQLSGHSVLPEQEAAHPHIAHLTPDDKLVICDYGTDSILTYDLNSNGKAQLHATFKVPAGSAPRHIVFNGQHPDIAYCICELSSTVLVLQYHEGYFSLANTYTLLPAGFEEPNTAAAIRLSPDQKYLYTSNRGHNSLVSFKISANGLDLEQLQTIKTQGDFPRDFQFDLTGNYVLVPHQKSNDVTVLKYNALTGYLTFLNNDVQVPEGTCILFY